jgi:hypothetical protein
LIATKYSIYNLKRNSKKESSQTLKILKE